MKGKIVPLVRLAGMPKVVLAHGSFDGLHFGHIRCLEWASSLLPGRVLIATITADRCFANKGHGRPAFREDVRAEWIAAIGVVDFVAIVDHWSALPAIATCRPTIYARGQEEYAIPAIEAEVVGSVGGKVMYMPKAVDSTGVAYSSTRILSGEYLKSRPRGIGEGDVGVQ